MAVEVDQPCYVIINSPSDFEVPKESQLKQDIENGNVKIKTEALKKLILALLNGDKLYPSMLILVIRYLLPSQDHQIKKLLLLFWEIVPKRNNAGKLLPEMILVCDAYRKDLQHPNEFIRGSTLRFLCKLKEPELLEPLMPSIRNCLDHKHSYVRRNAVLAIYTIYRNFEFLIPDAPELIANFLESEQDASCKRNAFIMLIYADQEKALAYLHSCIDQVQNFNDILQLVIVELIYKVCRNNPSERSRFIRCIYNLLNSSSNAVKYEAAGTLITISSAPTAIKAATSCYIDLIVKESDNNVKLIVLDKLLELKDQSPNNERVLQEMMMDVLRLLNSNDLEVKAKTLELALELTSSRNVQDLIGLLKKEIIKMRDNSNNVGASEVAVDGNKANNLEELNRYKKMLIKTARNCLFPKYPEILIQALPVLMECILGEGATSNSSESPAAQVVNLVRESIQTFPQMTNVVVPKLLEIFPTVKCSYIFRGITWILGEYVNNPEYIQSFQSAIQKSLGKIPLIEDEKAKLSPDAAACAEDKKEENDDTKNTRNRHTTGKPIITSDGTYATQSAFESKSTFKSSTKDSAEIPVLRKFLNNGDFFVASSLANDLTKIALKFAAYPQTIPKKNVNVFIAKVMLMLASILRFGKSSQPKKPITLDDTDRIMLCLKVLANHEDSNIVKIFTEASRQSLARIVALQTEFDVKNSTVRAKKESLHEIQPDTEISFMALLDRGDLDNREDQFESSLLKAIGNTSGDVATFNSEFQGLMDSSKLNKVTQLTGFSDPVYAEAYVDVVGRDIRLDVLIVNQTSDTLQHLDLELATLGDLKIVEKPIPMTLSPNDFCNIKASVKVTSTENGIIFGNIVYEVSSGGTHVSNAVILNEIHIDIVDYVVSAHEKGSGKHSPPLTDAEFRRMWTEFEWENKVCVHRVVPGLLEEERSGLLVGEEKRDELSDFLAFLISKTNMTCLTPKQALKGDCGFLAANLYAKSIFGEDALANVCVEKSRPTTTHEKFHNDKSPSKQLHDGEEDIEVKGEDNSLGDDVTSKSSAVIIQGHIRIRAKTQGMALSLGDKMNQIQKMKH